ncbi:MAG: glycoside hydrolase family 5 protein [Lachnospiraceae bacterium]|nr:glycoside hydrolase family 5 protein [Lachnospiraceae bacterium]
MKKIALFSAIIMTFSLTLVSCGNSLTEESVEMTKETLTEETVSVDVEETDIKEASNEPATVNTDYPVDADKFTLSAVEFSHNLKAGWNLGNTLDCQSYDGLRAEVAWGQPMTTRKLIDYVKEAGFTSIRIPVSWGYHVSGDDHKIDEEWMARVKEIVDWAIEDDLYVIINSHHDNDFYYPTDDHMDKSVKYLSDIWVQVSEEFRAYDEHLIFEAMNEPRLSGTGKEWYFNTGDQEGIAALRNIEKLNETFVNIVRASGGNNTLRYLMLSGYAGNPDLTIDNGFTWPADPANHLIMSIHAYSPYDFAMNPAGYNDWNETKVSGLSFMDKAKEYFIDNGIGVSITEMGAINKRNDASREAWYNDYTKKASSLQISCFVWDNGNNGVGEESFAFLSRKVYKPMVPELLEALTKNY